MKTRPALTIAGTLLVLSTAVTAQETNSSPENPLLDGIRLTTSSRIIRGLLVKEDATNVYVKSGDRKTPVVVPKVVILTREKVKVRESEAYTPEERVDQRAAGIDPKDVAGLKKLAAFASGLRLFKRARGFYEQAAAADPSRKEEIKGLVAGLEKRIREARAEELLAEIRGLAKMGDYPKAIERAGAFLKEFGDTAAGKENPDLVAALEKEAEARSEGRVDALIPKVRRLVVSKRSALIAKYSRREHKLQEVLKRVPEFDALIASHVAKALKATPEEVRLAWSRRERKPRNVGFGSGSWIPLGGQDGGWDTDSKAKATPRKQDEFTRRLLERIPRVMAKRKPRPEPQSVDLAKKLQTREEWWAGASTRDRRAFVEAEYARKSGWIEKKALTRKCSTCYGKGYRKTTRLNVKLEVQCARCHGVMVDVSIRYE